MNATTFIQRQTDGILVSVKVQPRAARNEIGQPLGDALRIKVTAPPVDSAANDAAQKLLAAALGVSRRDIQLIRGRTSRNKVFKIYGKQAEAVVTALLQRGAT